MYLTVDAKAIDQNKLNALMHKVFSSATMLNVNYINDGNMMTYTYNVEVSKGDKSDSVIKRITALKGVKTAEILAAQNIVEF